MTDSSYLRLSGMERLGAGVDGIITEHERVFVRHCRAEDELRLADGLERDSLVARRKDYDLAFI